jgi:hypothetical protein
MRVVTLQNPLIEFRILSLAPGNYFPCLGVPLRAETGRKVSIFYNASLRIAASQQDAVCHYRCQDFRSFIVCGIAVGAKTLCINLEAFCCPTTGLLCYRMQTIRTFFLYG